MPISVNMTRMPHVTYLEEEELVIYAANQMIDNEIDSLPIVRKKTIKIRGNWSNL